ncbi:Glycosyl transferase, group 1 [Methanosarcina lacustris Z-7289]|uniref:Glycosyl transferase, group 1 n=1 Tax=Methanosarcina lacustris Z-7289 TaxID=1434111 RepID=A0A0E3S6Y8_9EURY|nr:glycosyltransferase family 4 protein [Methanosarcina lacustris]AKB75112.1 Glycosyl transferase, group 1 [Methanosarcina lacustris Z-7289]
MVRVLMCGSIASSGGVSTHTRNLIENLSVEGNEILLYNYYTNDAYSKNTNIRKIYRRTFGLFFHILANRKRYEIIHDQTSGGIFSFVSSITASIASKIVDKKLIVTFHHSRTEEFVTKYKPLFNFVLKNTDTMILVSNRQKEFISRTFPKYSDKLVVIPNGYDSTIFFPRNTNECRSVLKIPGNKKVIFNISNLIDIKGHKYLIEAIGNVAKTRSDFYCIIAGKGYLFETLEQQIKDSKLEDYIKLVGWIPDNDIPIYINTSDFFVLPSLGEGNPIVMFEAIGCGKPFIGTKVGGIPEIIISEDYGLLCEPASSEELERTIISALDKNWDSFKIREYAKSFTWRNIAKTTKSVYEQSP